MIALQDPSLIWLIVVAFLVAFVLAFSVGANDVANSFGTSVGSGVLTLRGACILATIFEVSGCLLLGHQVSATIRKGVFNVDEYRGEEQVLMVGYLSALVGSGLWNMLATILRLPVSGTHAIIGAILGSHLVSRGLDGIQWATLARIFASWFVSPFLSGVVSVSIYWIIQNFLLTKERPLELGLRFLPFFYGVTVFINFYSIIHDGPSYLYLDNVSWWLAGIIALIVGLVIAICVWFLLVPQQRKIIEKQLVESVAKESADIPMESLPNGKALDADGGDDVEVGKESDGDENPDDVEVGKDDRPEIAQLFKYLQILTACFGGFAHGANDVSNAIGPLVGIMLIWLTGNVEQNASTPFYILLYGGVGISIGLWVLGKNVIQTVGHDLTKITPSKGFTIELGAATTVLLASKIGIPVSTTHCKVGSVVSVGKAAAIFGGEPHVVDWKLFGNIFAAWILTVPVAALCSALANVVFKAFLFT